MDGPFTFMRRTLGRTMARLPQGQLGGILRHTFALHFMMNDGNIFALQKASALDADAGYAYIGYRPSPEFSTFWSMIGKGSEWHIRDWTQLSFFLRQQSL